MKNLLLSGMYSESPSLEGLFQSLINGICKFLSPLFKVLVLLLLTCFLASGLAAQTKTVKKMQEPLEWAHYEKTWFKKAKKTLTNSLSDTKKSKKRKNRRRKQGNTLARLRNKISGVAKKGGSEL